MPKMNKGNNVVRDYSNDIICENVGDLYEHSKTGSIFILTTKYRSEEDPLLFLCVNLKDGSHLSSAKTSIAEATESLVHLGSREIVIR